jgi:ComF family protein
MRKSNKFLNLFIFNRCIICGHLITKETQIYPLCSDCELKQIRMNIHACSVCAYPLISEKDICIRCRYNDYNYISNRSLFIYSGDIKELMYQYKFKNRKKLSLYFAKYLAEVIIEYYPESIIVPVPGRKIVKKRKGWEHIELISNILKTEYNISIKKLLIRKGKMAQKALSRDKRAENLQQNIKIAKKIKNLPQNIVLIDDVFTTGTTINECAGILKKAGAGKIFSLTIAID